MRHGPAESRDPTRFPDDDLRPLTTKGKKRINACAKGMKVLGFVPERILFSPTVRTRETALLLARAFKLSKSALKVEPALHYDSDPGILVRTAGTAKTRTRTLWIGHEPWLGEALGQLLEGPPVPFRKGALALVAPARGRTRKTTLSAFLQPEILSALS